MAVVAYRPNKDKDMASEKGSDVKEVGPIIVAPLSDSPILPRNATRRAVYLETTATCTLLVDTIEARTVLPGPPPVGAMALEGPTCPINELQVRNLSNQPLTIMGWYVEDEI